MKLTGTIVIFTVGDETYIGTHRTVPVSLIANCKSYATDCKRDNSACKFCQPLQSVTITRTAIQLTITMGGGRQLKSISYEIRTTENVAPALRTLFITVLFSYKQVTIVAGSSSLLWWNLPRTEDSIDAWKKFVSRSSCDIPELAESGPPDSRSEHYAYNYFKTYEPIQKCTVWKSINILTYGRIIVV